MRFVPIEESDKPVSQPRFVPITEPQATERAPEEFPPGIAGAGLMRLPRDFSIPVETPPSAALPIPEAQAPVPTAPTETPPYTSRAEALDGAAIEAPPSIVPKETSLTTESGGEEKPGVQFFTELGRGAARAATADLPSMWQSTKILKDVGAAATVQNRLDLFNKIESGAIQSFDQLRGLDATTSEARSYLGTTPENRAKMRERLDRELANRKDLVKASIDTIRAYQEDAKKYSPAVDRPRDIGSAADFVNWVGSTVGSGAVQIVPLMLAAAATGGVGLGTMAVGLGTAESVSRRLQYIQEQVKNLPVEEQADKIAAYIQETGDTSIATGIASGSLDVVLGPAARLLRLRSGAIAPAATRGEAVRREVRAIPGQMGSEAITGSAQEALQLGAETKIGETPEFASRENLIKILEAAATEGVGSLGGAPINIGMAAAQAPRGQPTPERVEPDLPTTVPAPATPEPTIETEPAVEGRPEPTITTEPPVIGREEPLLPGEAPATGRVAPPAEIVTIEEPSVPAGFVRVYHSGSAGEGDFGRWVSTNKRYASDYRKDLPLFYTDIQADDPRVNNPDYPDTQGIKQGFVFNFELTPQEATTLREIPREPTEAPATGRVAPSGIGLPDVEEDKTPVVTVAPPAEIVTTAPTEPPPSGVSTVVSEGIPIVYPLVSALKLSDDVPQFKEDADQKGVVNKLTGKFDFRDFGAIQVWQRLNGNLEVISGRHRLDLAQRSGIQRVPAQIYQEADGFTAQDAAILDAELNIRDEKGTVKDYVQYFQGSGITQEEAQSRGLLDNVKGQRAFNIANFGSPELIASHGARQLSDEAASQIALAAPQDSRLQAVGLKVRQDGKSDEAAVNAVRAVKAIAREQNTTTDMFGFDDSLIKEAVEMAKIAERKQKELANRITLLSKVSKNPKIAEQEGIDIKDPKAVAARINDLKAQRAAWNNWDTNPDLINEIRQERGGFELTGETEAEIRAREEAEEAARKAEAEAERKARADRERGEFVLTGSDRPADVAEAYGQESLFGAPVDPIARVWSGLKTAEMPEFNELSSDAQATVKSLVDQGQLTPNVAREIAEDDEINRASPLRETIKAKVGVNKARVAKLLGQQLYGVTSEMPKVTLKELFQNAFDATKEAIEKGQIQQGNISIVFNESDRSIEVIDNGMGMPSSVMGKEFLEIAGSKKGTARSSGGFGIAKIQFLYGNKQLEVISLRDGVLSKMVTTGDVVHAALEGRGPAPDIQIIRDPDEIQQAIERYFPEGHGTSVKVTVPDSYQDSETRQTVELPFDAWSLPRDPSLRLSPLFTDVNVQVARLYQSSERDNLFDNRWRFDDVEIGSKFPTDSYAPVSSVKFPWGSAVVYTSTQPTNTNANFNVLSNGLWQFTEQIGIDLFKPLPRSFYIDVIPSKSAGDLGYPFELNRQGFTKAAEQDINAIKKYLKILYSQTDLAEDVKDFGTVQYINNNGTVTTPAELKPSIPTSSTPTLPTIKPTDKVEIKDGRMSVNGKVLPDISEQEMKGVKIDVDALTIDQGEIDANKVLFHNNAENKNTKDSLYKMAVDKFGEERVNKYFYGVGKTFLRLRNALVSVDPTYADMAKEGIGISLDTKYLGVNIRVPFKGMFINPAYAKLSNTPAQVAVAIMGTMQHEMAHFKQRNHGGEFASEMQRINALLDTHPSFDIFALKKYFIAHMKENEDIFNFLKTEFDSGNLQSIGKRFADSSYEQIRDDGDSGAVEGAGRGREGRPRVSEGTGEGIEAARESTEPTGVSGGTEGQRGRDTKAARQEVNDLLDQYNRPVVLGRETKDAQRTLLPTATRLKEIYKSASDADGRAADSLNGLLHRGLAFARNKLFFSGAGLEEADARRYGRQLVTDNDQATATLAVDNMLHGGGIAVEFLTRGGIEYNSNTKRIQAVKADQNMMDVYRLEKGLLDELGDKTAKGLINGYFEAKRSQNIKDEMASLTNDLEEKSQEYNEEYNNLQALLQNSQSSKAQIASQTKMVDRLKKESQELKQQLDDITQINEDKVLMDDDEIAAFIDQENNFPQLRQMMDSWTAQNHRLLGLMRQVRLISEKRYDRLIGIKDYVPWQRVQDDDGDVHGPAPSRSITRIPKEPRFKKGKVEAPIEYVIDNMTDNILRLTMNSLRQYAAGRAVSEYATKNEKGQVKTFPKEDRDRGRFAYISDGRRVVVEIKDPIIAEAVYGSDSVDLRMNEALAAATNFVRRAITVDPFFQMAQVIKDAPTAAIVTGVRNPAALMGQVMTSFTGVLFDTDPVADILRANGIGGFQSIARTPEKRLKQKVGLETRSIPQATLALLDHIGDASDFAARMAAYKRTMAETGNEALALYRAANVINFNRIGSSWIIRRFIRYVNFANAYLQSVDTLLTALSGRGMRGQSTTKAMTQVALTMSYLAGATLLYSFLIGDDEEYQKLDDATKVRNFFIPKKITSELGMENGILIPMNTTASFMFKALPELTYQKYVSQATQSPVDAARYTNAVAEAAAEALLGPEPVPSAVRPIIEIAMNRSFFTEKSLTPRGMETLEKSRQFTDQTSELAKQLGQFGGLSPIEWDHLIRGTTGTAGMLVQYGSNMIGEALKVRPESTTKQLPGVGRFVAPEFGRGREALFYDLYERVRKATSTLKDLEDTGEIDKADKFAKENEALIGLSRWSNKTEAKLKKLNAEIRLLSRGKEEGTAAERRRDIRELQQAKEEELEGIEFLRKVEAGL
jgi:hypothetical protein